MTPSRQDRPTPILNKRRAARFAAVQALYQAEAGDQPIGRVVAEFQTYRLRELFEPMGDEVPQVEVDTTWFEVVALGAERLKPVLDARIEERLGAGWTLDRLGYVLRACLRAGAYELAERGDVPVRVVINEYIEVSRLFFTGEEPRFINAVLDRLAPVLRAPDAAL